MSDYTLFIKDRETMTSDQMQERREYGSSLFRGIKGKNFDTGEYEENTEWTKFRARSFEYDSKFRSVTMCPHMYKTFLEDHFYRMYKGYKTHPWYKTPTDDPAEIEFYNYVAYECGHPEYIICTEKTETENNDVSSTTALIEQVAVEVLDKDGNVISGAETVEKPSKGEKESSEAKEPKKNEKQHMNDAVVFREVGANGAECWVDKDRHEDFKESNKKIIAIYKGLQKFVDICLKYNKAVKFYNDRGLVRADIYAKGVIAPVSVMYIDPCKIRPNYSVLYGVVIGDADIFDMALINFEEPYFEEMIASGTVKPEWVADARSKMANHQFFKHISYNAIKNADIAEVAANTYYLCNAMDVAGLDTRFKVIKYNSPSSMTLLCDANVGLGKFVKSNAEFNGMKIEVTLTDDGKVLNKVSGSHASDFVKLVGNVCVLDECGDILNDALKQVKGKMDSKKSNKKIELPNGR